jgi:hypothetical protein
VVEKTEGVITNEQSRDTDDTRYTRHRTKINVREHRRGNQDWTIQRPKIGILVYIFYILGGTADITVHEKASNGQLKELCRATTFNKYSSYIMAIMKKKL